MSAREEKGSAEDENDAHLYYFILYKRSRPQSSESRPRDDRTITGPRRTEAALRTERRESSDPRWNFFHIPHVFLIFDALIDCAGAILGTK